MKVVEEERSEEGTVGVAFDIVSFSLRKQFSASELAKQTRLLTAWIV